jgi:Fe-Mn family superoxide dismutase
MGKTKKNRSHSNSDKYKAVDYSYLLGKVKGIDDKLMKIHFKLYEGLVDATNNSIKQIEAQNAKGVTNIIEYSALQKQLPLFFNGMRLHESYFGVMCGENMDHKSKELMDSIKEHFGSFEKWKKNFASTGDIPIIGFACLVRDKENGKLYNIWIDQFNIGELIGVDVLLAMDMWEHAYLCQFGLDVKKYHETFLSNVNWSVVSDRFNKSASS